MNYEPKSIDEQIDCLARLTGAPDSFVAQVRMLFARKGISLEEDSTPYIRALEEAFVREESIRASATAQDAGTAAPDSNADVLTRSYLRQVDRLRHARGDGPRSDATRRVGPSAFDPDSRSLVVQPQRDDLPMVPGPEDLQ